MGIYKVQPDGHAPKGLKEGDAVVTAGGTYVITSVNSNGTYESDLMPGSPTTATYSGNYDTVNTNLSQYTGTSTQLKNELDDMLGIEPYSYSGSASDFRDPYDEETQAKLDELLNRDSFSYNPTTDENYTAYRKAYLREGDRAYRENLGQAAAMSGGIPSSYAYTAAAQGRDYYGSQLADKIPELYQAAYNRYLNEYQLDLSDLEALRGLTQDALGQYQTELSQFNADRDFDYNTYMGDYNMAANNVSLLTNLTDSEWERLIERAVLAAQNGDYSLWDEINAYLG